ncbi:hypothetical protein KA005_27820 [bacterium]|nr:hypothetical protein [bacterium]
MEEKEQAKSALYWMRRQAMEFNPDVTDNGSFAFCARVTTARIEKIESVLKNIARDGQGNVFLLQDVKNAIRRI